MVRSLPWWGRRAKSALDHRLVRRLATRRAHDGAVARRSTIRERLVSEFRRRPAPSGNRCTPLGRRLGWPMPADREPCRTRGSPNVVMRPRTVRTMRYLTVLAPAARERERRHRSVDPKPKGWKNRLARRPPIADTAPFRRTQVVRPRIPPAGLDQARTPTLLTLKPVLPVYARRATGGPGRDTRRKVRGSRLGQSQRTVLPVYAVLPE